MKYSKKQIKKLLAGIEDGSITESSLPEDYYLAIADYLKKALYKGFGGGLTDFSGKDLELLTELRDNVYMFSAAKTYQSVKSLQDCLFDDDGNLQSSRDFNKAASQTFDTWNNDWGTTEYNTAQAQAKMASGWNTIQSQKHILPILRYSTIGDACVICAPLDGLSAPVDDPVWNTIMPTNHFNCECIVTQEGEETEITPDDEKGEIFDKVNGRMSDTFKMNPGKDGYIFSPDHPYFQVSKGDKGYAKRNFDLPIPKKD